MSGIAKSKLKQFPRPKIDSVVRLRNGRHASAEGPVTGYVGSRSFEFECVACDVGTHGIGAKFVCLPEEVDIVSEAAP